VLSGLSFSFVKISSGFSDGAWGGASEGETEGAKTAGSSWVCLSSSRYCAIAIIFNSTI